MDLSTEFSRAVAECKNENCDKAMEIVKAMEKVAPNWISLKILKAHICHCKHLYVSELTILQAIEFTESETVIMFGVFLSLGKTYRSLGLSEKAVKAYLASEEVDNNPTTKLSTISNAIFIANDLQNFSAEQFHRLYDLYRRNLSTPVTAPLKSYRHSKIRVGYLSSDIRNHVVMIFSWFMLVNMDKRHFTVYCYFANPKPDAATNSIKRLITDWRDISKLSDEDAVKMIRADEIDILVDLSGHTSGNRLPIMAYRPARVQISGIGYMNSTGLDCVDYFISDRYCAEDDVAMKKYFTEKIIKLPHTHLCYAPYKPMPECGDAPCLVNGYITFGCFNNFGKVTDSMLIAWLKILRAVPHSRLILKHMVFITEECRNFVAERLQRLGYDISRVEMRGYSGGHMAEYNDIDIALDTYPYAGGTTTCEALYMGVPVISLYGDRHGTRFGYSILNNVGVGQLAADNIDDYIKLAIGLANDYELLSALHKNLRGMMERSPLMNQELYINDMEAAFKEIYRTSD